MRARGGQRAVEDDFIWRLRAGAASIAEVRTAFQGWLQRSPATEDDVDDLAVVLSELVSNALTGGVDGPVDVRAELQADVVELAVTNAVPAGGSGIVHWDLDDPLRGGGRGLMIVRAYTDAVRVDSRAGTVTVVCTRRLAGTP